ncbi:hypothetical protein [Micromonospora lupini]|nr:hypothetical protein [Micromonospora lupini]
MAAPPGWRCAEGAREMGYGGRMSERNQRVGGNAPVPVTDAYRFEGTA